MNQPGFQIRPARPGDEPAAYAVCLETGDSGRSAAHLYDDPDALGHIYVGPYLKLEPDFAFLLEDATGVCGYVLGATDSRRFFARFATVWLPELRRRHPEPSGDPARWSRTERLYYEYHHPDLFCPEPYQEYPSHLHIDLLPRAQGRGLGAEMIRALLDKLAAAGSPGVHLGMHASNARAERFYKKLGFHELIRDDKDSLYLGKRLVPRP